MRCLVKVEELATLHSGQCERMGQAEMHWNIFLVYIIGVKDMARRPDSWNSINCVSKVRSMGWICIIQSAKPWVHCPSPVRGAPLGLWFDSRKASKECVNPCILGTYPTAHPAARGRSGSSLWGAPWSGLVWGAKGIWQPCSELNRVKYCLKAIFVECTFFFRVPFYFLT